MEYCREISRQFRGLLVVLLDQSISMAEQVSWGSKTRIMDEATSAVNKWLQWLVIRCTNNIDISDWFDVAVISYHTDDAARPILASAFGGVSDPRTVSSISRVGNTPARMVRQSMSTIDPDTGESFEWTVELPIWIDAMAKGAAPMCAALRLAYDVVSRWIREANHRECLPPIVHNVTAGLSHDGDPNSFAKPLTALSTNYGNVLLFTSHMSAARAEPLQFPARESALPNEESRRLFRMSSLMPGWMSQRLLALGIDVPSDARGMAVNSEILSLSLNALEMGV
jgi:hypothetical protein